MMIIHLRYDDVDDSHDNHDANDWQLHKECEDDRSVCHPVNDNDDDHHHHNQLSIT